LTFFYALNSQLSIINYQLLNEFLYLCTRVSANSDGLSLRKELMQK